jgi:hypothetical protein
LLRTGHLCKGCGKQCREDYSAGKLQIQCPICEGAGCKTCQNGRYIIDRCPSQIVGADLQYAITIVGMAERGFLPEDGGSLDQSQWFLNLFSRMQSEINRIQSEEQEKAKSKYRSSRKR